MANLRYQIPRKLKRFCQNGSSTLQDFYQATFVNDIVSLRGEFDHQMLANLSRDELLIAKALVDLNLSHPHCAKSADAILEILNNSSFVTVRTADPT